MNQKSSPLTENSIFRVAKYYKVDNSPKNQNPGFNFVGTNCVKEFQNEKFE